MIEKSWKIKINDSDHFIKLKHNNILGSRLIFLDGIKLPESKTVFCFKEKTSFNIGEHLCELFMDSTGLQPKYFLSFDNKVLEESKQKEKTLPLPYWIWFFIVACGLIPIVSIEGIVALCTGIFGIYKCVNICGKSLYSNKKKAYICATVTGLSWIFIKLYMIAVKYLTIYLNGKLY